jgi:hypothetical protein
VPRHPPFTLSNLAIKSFKRESCEKFAFFSILFSKTPVRLGASSPGGEDFFVCHPEVVELIGIEPTTYGLQSRRSPS